MISWVSLLISLIAILFTGATFLLYRREFYSRMRPWVGVCNWNSEFPVSVGSEGNFYTAGVTITNFGSLPALDVSIKCSIEAGNTSIIAVKRDGWIIWPEQKEELSWNINPPMSKANQVKTTIEITYKLPFSGKTYAETQEIRDYWTGSRHFNDSPNKKSLAT